MSSLLYLLGAAAVGGILFATEGVPSSALSKSWATDVQDFFCKPGSGEYDPSFRIAGENFPTIVSVSLLFAFLTYKYARHTFVKILSCTAVIYSLTFAIIGYMRYTNVPEFKQICSQLAIRTESALLTEPKDLLAPFLTPLQFLPAKPFSNNSQVAYTYAFIYPHLGEYFFTIEPFLPYFFVLFAVWLEIKPLRNSFWNHLPVIGAVLSFAIMAISEQSDFINAEPKDLLLNTILQYAIYYLTTFILLAIYVMLFRLGMRRISVVGLLLILSRLHVLGLPKFEFHLEMLLFILLLSIMVVTCDFFPGTFLNFSLLAHYFSTYPPAGFESFVGWTRTIETGLVVMLISNAISQIGKRDSGADKRRVKQKKE